MTANSCYLQCSQPRSQLLTNVENVDGDDPNEVDDDLGNGRL